MTERPAEDPRELADGMVYDMQRFRHLFVSLTTPELAALNEHLNGLKRHTFDATDRGMQAVFPPGILGQGEFLIQLRIGARKSLQPERVYENFIKNEQRVLLVTLGPELRRELVDCVSAFMAPQEASDYAHNRMPAGRAFICTPKRDAYALYMIESTEPLPVTSCACAQPPLPEE